MLDKVGQQSWPLSPRSMLAGRPCRGHRSPSAVPRDRSDGDALFPMSSDRNWPGPGLDERCFLVDSANEPRVGGGRDERVRGGSVTGGGRVRWRSGAGEAAAPHGDILAVDLQEVAVVVHRQGANLRSSLHAAIPVPAGRPTSTSSHTFLNRGPAATPCPVHAGAVQRCRGILSVAGAGGIK